MAFEIKATPVLRGKKAEKFWKDFYDESLKGKQVLKLKTSPSLKRAIENLIKEKK